VRPVINIKYIGPKDGQYVTLETAFPLADGNTLGKAIHKFNLDNGLDLSYKIEEYSVLLNGSTAHPETMLAKDDLILISLPIVGG
jgi:hypothetical protein